MPAVVVPYANSMAILMSLRSKDFAAGLIWGIALPCDTGQATVAK